MTALFIFFVMGCFAVLPFQAPFIAALMYMWADSVDPQSPGCGFIRQLPMPRAAGLFAILTCVLPGPGAGLNFYPRKRAMIRKASGC